MTAKHPTHHSTQQQQIRTMTRSSSSTTSSIIWLCMVIAMVMCMVQLTMVTAQTCSCSCPTSSACPSYCQSCVTQSLSCSCTTNCTSLGCPSGTIQSASPDTSSCTGGQAKRTCTRTNCASTTTSTCAACKSGRYGTACALVCPGGLPADDGSVTNVCGSQGTCSASGVCTCNSGYTGANCTYSNHLTCNDHGTVAYNGTCQCDALFTGANCDQCIANQYGSSCNVYCQTNSTCNSHGSCNIQGACSCSSQYTGTACDKCATDFYGYPTCTYCKAATTCKNNGYCSSLNGTCICNARFNGTDCGSCLTNYFGTSCQACPGLGTGNGVCSGHGSCSQGYGGTGICACDSGYAGDNCQYSNAVTCNSHGVAQANGACVCNTGYSGTSCTACATDYFVYPTCSYCTKAVTCNNGGSCNTTGQCVCSTGFAGAFCDKCNTDYYLSAPQTCTYCKASSTCSGAGTCTATGTCSCNAHTSGSACNVCDAGYYGNACTPCPGGEGNVCNGVGTCAAGFANTGKCTCQVPYAGVDCGAPVITTISPSNGPTQGNTLIRLTGYFLGNSSSAQVQFSSYAGGLCSNELIHTATQIVCYSPAGEPLYANKTGRVQVRVARRDEGVWSYSNNDYLWTYDLPVISLLTPSNGPVLAGNQVTIDGSNFGVNTTEVYVGDNVIPATDIISRDHTRVIFKMSRGVGARTIYVRAMNRSSIASTVTTYTYDAPNVTSVTPTSVKTDGGDTVTINGINFGENDNTIYGVLSITAGSSSCTVVTRTDAIITCIATANYGARPATLKITSTNTASATFTLPYGAPTVTLVTGCVDQTPRTSQCLAGTTITVTGTNFGITTAASSPVVALTVTIAGYTCTSPTITTAHKILTCKLPAGPTGPNLLVTVSRGTAASFTGDFIDYLGPLITNGTLTVYGKKATSTPSLLVVPTTAGGTLIAFNGTLLIFGSNNTDVVVRYGPTAQPTKYGCTLRIVTPTYIACETAGGIGRDHRIVVTSGGVTSPRSADSLSYPAPTLTPSSLRLYPNTTATGSQLLVAATTQGDLIMMEGSGFGTSSADVTITYGGYTCITPTTSPQTDKQIICRTSPGEGLNYNFTVTVGRDASWSQSVTSWDQYSYPLSPVIESITGCDLGTDGTTINCPTDGRRNGQAVMLTIHGRYFSLFPIVTIGDVSCSPVTNLATDPTHVVMCPLPVGTGVLQSIVMKQGQYFSRATPLLSYAAPSVTSIMGCSPTGNNPLRAIDCNRSGIDRITINGANFGSQLATVLVGGLRCDDVVHDSSTPHQRLSCIVPGNVGLSRPIIVFAQGSSQQLPNNVYVDYQLCDRGTYPVELDCYPCPNGTYADQIGSDRCLSCPASTYTSSEGSFECTKCDAGTYAPDIGLSACITCEAGKYTPDKGAIICLECGIGTYSATNSSTSCTSCPLGKKQSATSQTSCDDCQPGEISGALAQSVCVPCGSGYYAPNGGLSVCSQCTAGNISASASGATRCDACIAGRFSPTTGLSFCSDCVIGRFNSLDSASSCDACARGRYQPDVAQQHCIDCEAGKFATGEASSQCASCPSGYFTAATGSYDCASCPPGSYSVSSASANCTLCEPGSFQLSAGQSLCNPCGEGTYQMNYNSTYCTRCETGTAIKATGATQCNNCTEGHYAPLTGFSECSLCPSGYVADGVGSVTCSPCVAGKYTSSEGSIDCDDCQPGRYSFGAATECNACPAGKISTTAGDGCVVCTAGFYASTEGQSQCEPCGYGTYAETEGRTHCDACGSGYVSLELNATACTTCPEGKYSESTTSCAGCKPGTYSLGGASVCTPCAQGSYQSLWNQTGCVPCAKGFVAASMGQPSCTACTAGYYVDTTGQISCFPCDYGSINSFVNATACSSCAAGTFRREIAGDQCSICTPGSFNRQLGQSQCQSCESGKFTAQNSSQICSSCEAGKYQDASRSTACMNCTVGRYSLGNTAVCIQCPGGQYQDEEGKTSCKACRAGTWTDPTLLTSMAACIPCALGYFAPSESSLSCQSCGVGTFAGTNGSTTCTPCERGFYQSNTAATGCIPCGDGTITASGGQSLCEPCVRGSIANTTGLTTCDACTKGHYQELPGQASCDECPTGKYQQGSGAFACVDCIQGKFRNTTGSFDDCEACPAGRFQSSPGRSECSDCAPGTFSAYASGGIVTCTLCLPGTANNITGQSACKSCPFGKYSGQNALLCTNCSAGTNAVSEGSSSCSQCGTGRYSGVGVKDCVACAQGYYQPAQGASSCLACEVAKFASTEGLTVCGQCAAGSHAPLTNQTVCDACPAGMYQDSTGRADCIQCAPGKFAGAPNAITCVPCLVNTVAPLAGTSQCLACSQNAESSLDLQTCLCSPGYYQPLLDATTASTVPCDPCPHGGDCTAAGTSLLNLAPLAGWWRADNQSIQFYKCLLPTHCANVRGDNCLDNRAGPLCALCIEGYRAQSGLGKCVACPTRSTGLGVTIILFILICAAALLMYYLVIRADRALVEQVAEADRRAVFWDQYGVDMDEETVTHSEEGRGQIMYKVKIMVSFMQIVTNMSVVLNVEWPSYFQTFTSYFSFMNLDFVPWQSVGCVSPFDYYAKLLVITTTPIGLVIAISLLYLLPRYIAARAQSAREEVEYAVRSHKRIRRMAWKLMLFTLFLLYPGVSSSILGMFVCRDINGKPYLFNDFSLECYDSTWFYYLPYILIMVAVYPVGIPLLFYLLLRRYQGRRHEVAVRLQLGFLYEAYNTESWWFELADMANKLIMTSVLPFLPPSGQLPAGLAFSVAYMILLVLRPPYRRKGDYRLALVAGVEIIMVSLAGLVISKFGASLDKATDVLLSVLFIAIIFLLLIAFLVLSYLNIVKLIRHMGWQEIKEFVLSGFKTKEERAKQAKQLKDEETEMIARDTAATAAATKKKAFSIYDDEDPDFGGDDGIPHLSKDPSFLRPLTSIGIAPSSPSNATATANGHGSNGTTTNGTNGTTAATNGTGSGRGHHKQSSLVPIGADQKDGDDDYKSIPMGMGGVRKPPGTRGNRGDIVQMSSNPLYEAEKDPFALQRTLSQRALENPRLAALQALRDDDDVPPPPPPPGADDASSLMATAAMDEPPPPPPSSDPFAALSLSSSAIPTDDTSAPVQHGRIAL